jgi:hypothetical protein
LIDLRKELLPAIESTVMATVGSDLRADRLDVFFAKALASMVQEAVIENRFGCPYRVIFISFLTQA